MFQSGGWPELEFQADEEEDELDLARETNHRQNCEALVALLRTSEEKAVEIYGVWDGDFAAAPKSWESITIDRLIDPHFCFKEKGFYRVYAQAEPHP